MEIPGSLSIPVPPRQSMKDLLEFCCEKRIYVFGDLNAKGSFNLQEQKPNE
jgi:hypothetical protein